MAININDYMPSLESIFKILKWILLVSNGLVIIGSIFVLISGRDLGEPEFRNNHRVLIFACFMIILFCLLGIVGVWRKHFPSVLTYAILMTIALLLEIAELSKEDVGSFFASSAIVLCAYVYAFLIRHYEKQEEMKRVFSHQTAKI
ncbi:uncharacterized protein LOC113792563 [Dermatophagoides pteronyssinus]|uniref:Uncharacterized protein LOC113792563 n=2 Tax=Dermatophagoides pteronyssinus TaxID=6956 RepID=A0A6P6XZG2_DERPT|nr:uncharacterized protein LOC113792563 [Dermatophagoides pteronyssinus]XP_027198266.1 uncharacterized protein LOC113792563 [Dermatophagoides pteronyssinus]XP_027198267.1 uncharacterized protein LOC113792563 [Dermatophagoides pteronyssinus]KAH9419892.1 hypothetical protein DERP_001725 [Dermatophagoides pteronyssinus]